MRDLSVTELDDRALDLADRIGVRRFGPPPPFWIWSQSIGLAEHVEPLGAYCRNESNLPVRLRELSVLIVARQHRSPFAWHAHYNGAIEAGVSRESLDRLARGDDPRFESEDEDVAFRFADTLLNQHVVDDDLFAETSRVLGRDGLVDFLGCLGSFSMSAWGLNVFKLGIHDGTTWPFPDMQPY